MQKAGRGLFVVFEGLDRSGKSTQTKKLAEYLGMSQGKCELMNFPNRQSESGHLLDEYLRNKKGDGMGNEAVHLLFSMNRWEIKSQILDKMNKGVHVVCDRYAYSGVAYSAAKGLDFEWCLAADRGLVKPDMVIYVNLSCEEITKRSGFGDERFEKVEFQQKVEEQFKKFGQTGVEAKDFLSGDKPADWILLDASNNKGIDEIHEEVKLIVDHHRTNFLEAVNMENLSNGLFK